MALRKIFQPYREERLFSALPAPFVRQTPLQGFAKDSLITDVICRIGLHVVNTDDATYDMDLVAWANKLWFKLTAPDGREPYHVSLAGGMIAQWILRGIASQLPTITVPAQAGEVPGEYNINFWLDLSFFDQRHRHPFDFCLNPAEALNNLEIRFDGVDPEDFITTDVTIKVFVKWVERIKQQFGIFRQVHQYDFSDINQSFGDGHVSDVFLVPDVADRVPSDYGQFDCYVGGHPFRNRAWVYDGVFIPTLQLSERQFFSPNLSGASYVDGPSASGFLFYGGIYYQPWPYDMAKVPSGEVKMKLDPVRDPDEVLKALVIENQPNSWDAFKNRARRFAGLNPALQRAMIQFSGGDTPATQAQLDEQTRWRAAKIETAPLKIIRKLRRMGMKQQQAVGLAAGAPAQDSIW